MHFKNKTFRFIWSICLLIGLSFSSLFIATATTPNPGHPWAEVGDAVFTVTGPTVMRTFTFPDADATVLTSLTNDFDRASTGTLSFGDTNATTVSICNSVACDTLTLATNADADTISIGDSLDTVAIAATNWSITSGGAATFASMTFTGNLDMGSNIITNIGNTGTDFVATTGALNLAGVLTANGGVTVAAGQDFSMSLGDGNFLQQFNGTTTTASSIVAQSLTSGVALSLSGGGANMTSGGRVMQIDMNAATTGNAASIITSGVYTGAGLIVMTANSATSGTGLDISMTGLTTGTGLGITGGTSMTTNGELLDLSLGAGTAGNGAIIRTTGVYTGTGLLTLTANSQTSSGTILNVSGTSLTSGVAVSIAANTGVGLDFTSASTIRLNSTTAGNTMVIKVPTNSAGQGTCATAQAEGIIFQNNAGTQIGRLACVANGTTQLTMFAQAFTAASTDLAEMYGTDPSENLVAGDVVSLSSSGNLMVTRTASIYDSKTIGVISDSPGLALSGVDEGTGLGDTSNGRFVALKGRVPVRVTDENGPIAIGDFLSPSSTPGAAMKAVSGAVVIGQALDSWTSGQGLIRVFVGQDSRSQANLESRLMALESNSLTLTSLNLPGTLTVSGSTVLAGGLQVDSISSLAAELSILSDLSIIGRPYFNKDTGGFAVIRQGDTFVRVTFEKPYDVVPVVQANVTFEQINDEIAASLDEANYFASGLQSVVSRKDETGFTIMLNNPANADLKFNWIALAITEPRTDESSPPLFTPVPEPTPAPEIIEPSAPAPEPAPESAPEPINEAPIEPTPETESAPGPTTEPESPPEPVVI